MTAPRTIASAQRPSYKLLSNGAEVPRSVHVLLVETSNEFNKIATARILLTDGDPATETFAHSSGILFVPGNEVQVQLGYNDVVETVFTGVIVKQKLSSKGTACMLEITCKHKAHRLTASEKYAVFQDVTDADVIRQKFSDNGLNMAAATTTVTHENLVQYKCADWDFAVNRAEANGQVVICTAQNDVKTIAPEVAPTADLDLQFGATILDFEAALDARLQEPYLRAQGWNYTTQQVTEKEAEQGDLATIGNLTPTDLSNALFNFWEKSFYTAIHTQQELDVVAEAEHKRRRLSKVRATVTIQGLATLQPGSTIGLHGLGERFEGNALVTGVLHAFKNGVWKTALQVGQDPVSHLETFKPLSKSAYAIPRTQGLEIGIVTDLEDPTGSFRVRVQFPAMGDQPSVWARMAQPDAGSERTVFFRPEIGDEVIVGFINDDPRAPIVLGALHSAAKASPVPQSNDNHIKGIVTRSGMKIIFDDDKKEILIETPGGIKALLSDDQGLIQVEDATANKFMMNSGGISMESPSDFIIKANGKIEMEATEVTITGTANVKVTSWADSELSSGGITKVKGSLVQIN